MHIDGLVHGDQERRIPSDTLHSNIGLMSWEHGGHLYEGEHTRRVSDDSEDNGGALGEACAVNADI